MNESGDLTLDAGKGLLRFEKIRGRTCLTQSAAKSPLKFFNPKSPGQAAWVYASSLGGGLLGGDAFDLRLEIGEDSVALLSTQASTKVYRSFSEAGQRLTARLAAGSSLVVAGDPLVCFAGSRYRQNQEYCLHPESSLVLLDWITSGRAALGERWAFDLYENKTTIHVGERLVVNERILLNPAHGELSKRLGSFNVLATVFILGPTFAKSAASILARTSKFPAKRSDPILMSASPVGDGIALRIAGDSTELVLAALKKNLGFLKDILGESPWARKY